MTTYDYVRDGDEIYRRSFAIIRSEARLDRFRGVEERVAVRVIHACGMPDVAADLIFAEGAAAAGVEALKAGAPIFCDSQMVAHGVTRARLPARNEVLCMLGDSRASDLARALGLTRSAAAVDLWRERLGGSVVAIGNAPTALYRLLEIIADGAALPACIVGMPVGFVGAAESKDALVALAGSPHIVVRGRRGGSAMAVATINALASAKE
jgi:precorrin-8X/cobalt-precorrin-8 methylmutase